MKMNMDIKIRDKMIFGSYSPDGYLGGCKHFGRLSLETLKELIKLEFADPEETQNCSPAIAEFVEFMENHPGYYAHGYVVSDKRSDYRVTVEGIAKDGPCDDQDELEAYVAFARFADEFDMNPPYCWWD